MQSATVLIVDDDAKSLRFFARVLRRGGYAVLTASDGCEVPEVLSRTPVDLLVLDLQMPGMNGWEVLRSLRATRVRQPLPKVVVISGRSEDDTAAFVRRLGADDFLTKPCWADQLLASVERVLAN
jgi:adenylate cyclase